MNIIKNFIYIIFTVFLITNTYPEQPEFIHFSMEEGLPGSNIRRIFQDNYGYLWIGIEAAGLCRYDGKQFVIYENNPEDSFSISNNFIWDIISDKKNNLWIATENGLNFFDRVNNKFYHFFPNFDNYKEINNNWILSLMFDHEGDLWIGHTRGAHIINRKDITRLYTIIEEDGDVRSFFSTIKIKSIFKNNYVKITVHHFLEAENNLVWLSTTNGLFLYNKKNRSIKHYKSDGSENSLINNTVYFITRIKERTYLVGTDRGMNRFNAETEKFEILSFPEILKGELALKGFSDALIDNKERIWIAQSEGIILGTPDGNDYTYSLISEGETSLNSKIIRDLFISKSGLILVGTKFGGLNIHNMNKQVFPYKTLLIDDYSKLNTENNFILSCYEDNKKRIWLGSKYCGLALYDPKTDVISNPFCFNDIEDEIFASRVETIFQLKNCFIITGTPRGFCIYNPDNMKWIKNIPFKMVNCIKRDSYGNTWLGSRNGLFLLNEKDYTIYSYEKENSDPFFSNTNIHIKVIFEDRSKRMWFGTRENGLYIYDPLKESVVHKYHEINNNKSLSGDMVRDIQQDKYGRVWIATKHAGLCYYDSLTNEFSHFSKLDGLPSNTIYSIVKDLNGDLWLGTHHGLSKLDIENLSFTNYDRSHGLQSNIFENDARLITTDGKLLFGGKNGFNVFYPDSIKIKPYNAPLIISSVKVNDKTRLIDINHDTTITLKYDQNYLSFEFALLDYRNTLKNIYKYKLEGVDKDWIESENRNYISYPQLRKGNYTFKLMAMSQDNEWKGPISVGVSIRPPFWSTKIAFFIYLVIILAVLILIYNFATLRAHYTHRLNEAKSQVQSTMDLNRSKLYFFTNISHELRTPLSLMMAPLEKLMNSEYIISSDQNDLDLVYRNTKRLNNLINQLLYFRKTEQKYTEMKVVEEDIVGFIKEVVFPYYELAAKQKTIFNIISDLDEIKVWFDPDKLEKIISNVLMNAFKFTPPGGKIIIFIKQSIFGKSKISFRKRRSLKKSIEAIQISVKDTGIGMTKDQIRYIFDRFYVGDDHKKGIGIGLEITKTLVEMHGGYLTVESEHGTGSTFHIWLRLGNHHYKKEYISDQKIEAKDYTREIDHDLFTSEVYYEESSDIFDTDSDNKDKKPLILIVDDNKDLCYFLSVNLSNEYDVITAENGLEGLKLAKERCPDLILCDIMMPDMDGIEMCRNIKNHITTSHIPVILLTAKAQIENKLEGMATGADDYIEKPFNFQFLQLRIRNLFRSRNKLREQILENISEGTHDELKISEYDKKFLENCKTAIEQNFADPKFSVVELSKFVGMSRSQLHRKLKVLTGNSPIEWIYNYRLIMAKKMLKDKKYNVSDVAYMTGFNSPSSFSTVFRKKFGLAPSEIIEK